MNSDTPKRPRNDPGHRAGGARPGAGRPPGTTALSETETARYQHWREWWKQRKQLGVKLAAAELARRMEEAEPTVRAYANGGRSPGPVALANLESLSASHGFEPLTAEHQFL